MMIRLTTANSVPKTLSFFRLSSVNILKTCSLKPLGQLNSNLIWILFRTVDRKFVQTVLVTRPRWPPCPYMVKGLKNLLQKQKEDDVPGRVAQSVVSPIADPGFVSFLPTRPHTFVEIHREIFSTIILLLPLIQEGSCQLQGKVCTQTTG